MAKSTILDLCSHSLLHIVLLCRGLWVGLGAP